MQVLNLVLNLVHVHTSRTTAGLAFTRFACMQNWLVRSFESSHLKLLLQSIQRKQKNNSNNSNTLKQLLEYYSLTNSVHVNTHHQQLVCGKTRRPRSCSLGHLKMRRAKAMVAKSQLVPSVIRNDYFTNLGQSSPTHATMLATSRFYLDVQARFGI